MIKIILTFLFFFISTGSSFSQVNSLDSLKKEILQLRMETNEIKLNISTSQKKFKSGILVATIGYTVTIAGGLMLGRENDDLGQVLLVAGGATGITGTYMMVDAFSYLSGRKKNKKELTTSLSN